MKAEGSVKKFPSSGDQPSPSVRKFLDPPVDKKQGTCSSAKKTISVLNNCAEDLGRRAEDVSSEESSGSGRRLLEFRPHEWSFPSDDPYCYDIHVRG